MKNNNAMVIFVCNLSINLLWLALILEGCRPFSYAPPTKSVLTRSPLPTITIQYFLTETLSTQPTSYATITIQQKETNSNTWSPLPTLSTEDAAKQIDKLMITNGNCELPCWWGIQPGKTTWQDARTVLYPIAWTMHDESSLSNQSSAYIETLFDASKNIHISAMFYVKELLIQEIEIRPRPFNRQFRQKEILSEFGVPEIIYINTIKDQRDSFRVAFYYPQKGIFALYNSELLQPMEDELMKLCMKDVEYMQLNLWSPENYSFENSRDYIFNQYGGNFFSIGDVSDYTPQIYTDTIIENGDSDTCILVPSKYWETP
jgi:hypothetical protein